jgi:hypothetical protein
MEHYIGKLIARPFCDDLEPEEARARGKPRVDPISRNVARRQFQRLVCPWF